MIVGIGCDIVSVTRIRHAIQKDSFLRKYFTVEERNLFSAKKDCAESVAGIFAAKEAIAKAMGTGIQGFAMEEIEIKKDGFGKPFAVLTGRARKIQENLGICRLQVTISHEREYAVAYAVAEGGKKRYVCGNSRGNARYRPYGDRRNGNSRHGTDGTCRY